MMLDIMTKKKVNLIVPLSKTAVFINLLDDKIIKSPFIENNVPIIDMINRACRVDTIVSI